MKYCYEELSKLYRLDIASPSGIVWNQDRYAGRDHLILMASDGDIAGSPSCGYWLVQNGDVKLCCHRIVYCLHNRVDLDSSQHVDHVDGNGFNNTEGNLRLVSHKINSRNRRKREDSKTGVTGVCLRASSSGRKYYQAYWQGLDGKQKYSPRYYTDTEGAVEAMQKAIEARNVAISKLNADGAGYTVRHGN